MKVSSRSVPLLSLFLVYDVRPFSRTTSMVPRARSISSYTAISQHPRGRLARWEREARSWDGAIVRRSKQNFSAAAAAAAAVSPLLLLFVLHAGCWFSHTNSRWPIPHAESRRTSERIDRRPHSRLLLLFLPSSLSLYRRSFFFSFFGTLSNRTVLFLSRVREHESRAYVYVCVACDAPRSVGDDSVSFAVAGRRFASRLGSNEKNQPRMFVNLIFQKSPSSLWSLPLRSFPLSLSLYASFTFAVNHSQKGRTIIFIGISVDNVSRRVVNLFLGCACTRASVRSLRSCRARGWDRLAFIRDVIAGTRCVD